MTTFQIIIVTHNSEHVLSRCLEHLLAQSVDSYRITILDSGSRDPSYLDNYANWEKITFIHQTDNVGFSVGNNIAACKVIDQAHYFIFLNPDIFLPPDFLLKVSTIMDSQEQTHTGILGAKLLRYNLDSHWPTDEIDSTGIFQKWYGKWYDRGQGQRDRGQFDTPDEGEPVPAVCGALMICRREALEVAALSKGEYFRNDFFMYKEDIELSLRVAESGYKVVYNSYLIAWHTRGWQSRKSASRVAKLCSARNELQINRRLGLIKHLYSRCKLILARSGI
ncbi:glycosyltransferase [Candidatus Neomarinimicrobiota bacterium]